MSDPVDKQACLAACDLIEENGFDPEVVAFFREACRPTVAEVLPLAIAYLRGPVRPGIGDFFERDNVEDNYLAAYQQFGRDNEMPQLEELMTLLLEMSVGQRRKVARRAREAIRDEEDAVTTPAIVRPDGLMPAFTPPRDHAT